MYALITNGVATKYPYTVGDLRRDNPNISFPKILTQDVLSRFGLVDVQIQSQPSYDLRTQRVETSNLPVLIDSVWTITKTAVNKTPEQIAADDVSKSVAMREARNKLLTDSDWTQVLDAPVDRTAWAAYRQALRDLPQQEGFPWIDLPAAP